jgi:hypothetical protein
MGVVHPAHLEGCSTGDQPVTIGRHTRQARLRGIRFDIAGRGRKRRDEQQRGDEGTGCKIML